MGILFDKFEEYTKIREEIFDKNPELKAACEKRRKAIKGACDDGVKPNKPSL